MPVLLTLGNKRRGSPDLQRIKEPLGLWSRRTQACARTCVCVHVYIMSTHSPSLHTYNSLFPMFVCRGRTVHAVAFFCVNELRKMQELKQGCKQETRHGWGVHDQGLISSKRKQFGEDVWCCSMVHVFLFNSYLSVLSTHRERWGHINEDPKVFAF